MLDEQDQREQARAAGDDAQEAAQGQPRKQRRPLAPAAGVAEERQRGERHGLYRALGKAGRDPAKPAFCDACFTGDYAIPLTDRQDNAERPVSLLQPAAQ